MNRIAKYDMFEVTLPRGVQASQPSAIFTIADQSITIQGFSENDSRGTIRFMPMVEGVWHYELTWGDVNEGGDFLCTPTVSHGPVRADGFHFHYADGTRYFPIGTTCYAWVHQPPDIVAQTIETLKASPFNKLRMCLFPKSMPYNSNDPAFYPYEKRENGDWDMDKPDPRYWNHLDDCLKALLVLNIEADIILFHPYDRWGFSTMSQADNLQYLRYAVRRLSAYRNVWWALSNEYEFSFQKTFDDWDRFGDMIAVEDPYHHLVSAHNWITPYPKRDWMTHVSYQGSDPRNAFQYREQYRLPMIVDEIGYEGNIDYFWGNLSGFEFMHRVWSTVAFGCYAAHGETFHQEDEVLWWAKGGKLYGEAPARMQFLKDILESLPAMLEPACVDAIRDPNGNANNPGQKAFIERIWAMNSDKAKQQIISEMTQPIGHTPDCKLIYFGRSCPSLHSLRLPENGKYRVEILDIWEMTRRLAVQNVSGSLTVGLPGKEGIALLITRLAGDAL